MPQMGNGRVRATPFSIQIYSLEKYVLYRLLVGAVNSLEMTLRLV